MAKLVVFGATGFAGKRITAEALLRGDQVMGVARHIESLPGNVDGLLARVGSIHDEPLVTELAKDADALVVAVPARGGGGEPDLADAVPMLARVAEDTGVRLAFVGGAGSLETEAGGPRLLDTADFPDAYKPEANAHAAVLAALRALPADVDWFYLSPPAEFGSWVTVESTGRYRTGDDVLLVDAKGDSTIAGEDYALAFVDEIAQPLHSRRRFTVGY